MNERWRKKRSGQNINKKTKRVDITKVFWYNVCRLRERGQRTVKKESGEIERKRNLFYGLTLENLFDIMFAALRKLFDRMERKFFSGLTN